MYGDMRKVQLGMHVLYGPIHEDADHRGCLRTYIEIQNQVDIDNLIQHLETNGDKNICVLNLEVKAHGTNDPYLIPPLLIKTKEHREDLKVFLQRILFEF